jgi:hypothetical protein
MSRYHVRNQTPLDDQRRGEESAKSQEGFIRLFFDRAQKGSRYTPFQVWALCFQRLVPITSVRRALSNLTEDGFLQKNSDLKDQMKGIHGKSNCTWSKKEPAEEKQTTLFDPNWKGV